MVGNELEQEIISLYSEEIISFYSINQIAHKLGKKYPYINKKMNHLIKEGIFKKTITGRSYLCSLDLANDETIYLLILNEIKKKKELIKKKPIIKNILEYLTKLSRLTSLCLAVQSNEKIFLVVPNQEEKDKLEKAIIKEALKGFTPEAVSLKSFKLELLKNKELRKDRTILLGYEKYYEIIREIGNQIEALNEETEEHDNHKNKILP